MLEIEDIYYNRTTSYTSKWSHYFELYERHLDKFTYQNPSVLEIGVDNGGSLQMWWQYFGNGVKLYGVDNRPKFAFNDPKAHLGYDVNLLIGEQGDPSFWDKFNQDQGPMDVVIDDGSHYSNHQILTFEKLFPSMNDGGVYFVEDTHSSYMSTFYGELKGKWTFIEYCKNLIDILHEDHYTSTQTVHPWMRWIKGIHFYDSVVVIEKGLRQKNHVTYARRETAI